MNGIKTPYALKQKDGNFIIYTNSKPQFISPSNSENNGHQKPLNKISPVLVLVIIILAVIFFLAGLVHLLLRLFIKRPIITSSSPMFQSNRFPENSHSHALQRQLRQLFRLHDSGLDQAVIDSLPVFRYKDIIIGPKQPPFDCAVCLSEFAGRDELRLLPPCGHAFHAGCIDTWLLSNSTCPLCRRPLLASDIFSAAADDDRLNVGLEDRAGSPRGSRTLGPFAQHCQTGSLSVRLGKFQSGGEDSGETSGGGGCILDDRRCYSMGTFRYVEVGELSLRVALNSKLAEEGTISEEVGGELEGKKIGTRRKGESFSVSKIWLWSKNGRFPGCTDTEIHVQAQSAHMV